MPEIVVYDRKGNKVTLEAVGKGLFEKLDDDGKGTGNIVNLKTALGCKSYFTEEQHERFLERQEKGSQKRGKTG